MQAQRVKLSPSGTAIVNDGDILIDRHGKVAIATELTFETNNSTQLIYPGQIVNWKEFGVKHMPKQTGGLRYLTGNLGSFTSREPFNPQWKVHGADDFGIHSIDGYDNYTEAFNATVTVLHRQSAERTQELFQLLSMTKT